VHQRLHARRARVAEDATGAQRPRAELHAAVEPADHLAVGQRPRYVGQQVALARERPAGRLRPLEEATHLLVGQARPEQAALLRALTARGPRLLQKLVPDEHGSAEGAAGVAGRGLYPDGLERPLAQQPAVGDAVEGDAAGEDEVLHPGAAVQVAGLAEDDLFG